jgi:LysR family transcriptional regulator for bpeEF and oprC
MDNLNSIIAFIRVTETGSFAKAGQCLGLSGSAVSKSVGRLEQRLGLRLLHRTTRSISLTDDGRILHDRCIQILSDLEDAERALMQSPDVMPTPRAD